jgi:hypothetical protein
MDPTMLLDNTTDDELEAALEALQAGHVAHWRFAGEAAYKTTYWHEGEMRPRQFRRIWLDHASGRREAIVLRHAPESGTWRVEPDH